MKRILLILFTFLAFNLTGQDILVDTAFVNSLSATNGNIIAINDTINVIVLKNTSTHPAAYKGLFVNTATGVVYSQDISGWDGTGLCDSVRNCATLDSLWAIHTNTSEPTGFINRTSSVCSFIDATRIFTIQPTVTTFEYYSMGRLYSHSIAKNVTLTDDEGIHYIYFEGETLRSRLTWTDSLILNYALVWYLYYDDDSNIDILYGDERHGAVMDGKTHQYEHNVNGAVLSTGGELSSILVDQSGDLASHAQFGNTISVIWDEDNKFTNSARSSTATIPIYYRSGVDANDIWRVDESGTYGVKTTGTGRAAWNELTGGSWQLTEVSNNDFVLAHIAVTTDAGRPFVVFMGQNEYANRNAARAGANVEINSLITSGMPTPEFRFIATVIYQTSTGYANPVKSRTRSTDGGDDYIDLRNEIITRGGTGATVVSHLDLADIDGGSTTEQYHMTLAEHAIAIQAAGAAQSGYLTSAAQTIGGKKTFNTAFEISKAGEVLPRFTSTDHDDVGIELVRTGNTYHDWRMINDGGLLRLQKSENDGTTWNNYFYFDGTQDNAYIHSYSASPSNLRIGGNDTIKFETYNGSSWIESAYLHENGFELTGDARPKKHIYLTGKDMTAIASYTYNGESTTSSGSYMSYGHWWYRGFDASVSENAISTFVLDSSYDAGTDLEIEIQWYDQSTGANEDVVWYVSFAIRSVGDIMDATFLTWQTETALSSTTAYELQKFVKVFTGTSFMPGDIIGIAVYRDADAVADDMPNDARLSSINVHYRGKH